jgi:hypothetical protein
VFYDDSEGPQINLMPFFEAYSAAVEDNEIELATERAALSRADLELRVARVNRGLPER